MVTLAELRAAGLLTANNAADVKQTATHRTADDSGAAVIGSLHLPLYTTHGAFMKPWVRLYNRWPRSEPTEMRVVEMRCCR
jgi:hypothetical protein